MVLTERVVMRKSLNKMSQGFTVTEVIIVVIVLGILTSISILSYGSWRNNTLATNVKVDLEAVATAMEDYRNFNDEYPSSIPTTAELSGDITFTLDGTSSTTYYCVEGVSDEDASVAYYISSDNHTEGAQAGSCP